MSDMVEDTALPRGVGEARWWRRRDVVIPLIVVTILTVALAVTGVEQVRFRVDVRPDGSSGWDWTFFWALVPEMLKGLLVLARATVFGFAVALVVGLAFALGRRSKHRVISWPTAGLVEFVRSTPLLVQLYFLYFALPDAGLRLGRMQALVIGLGIHYGAYCSEAYRAGINSVPDGQWEAATAMNLGRTTTWTRVILPQAIPNVLPALGNFLVAAFKDAPLGYAITVTEVLFFATTISGRMFRPQEPFILIGIGFLLVSLPAAWLVRRLEARLAYDRI